MLQNNVDRPRLKASSCSNGFDALNLSPKLLALSLSLLSPLVFASPVGGNISAGTGAIDQAGTSTTITQQSQSLAIDWQSFNVGTGETVNFIQPNVFSIALNRVLGQDPSSILGNLTANGQVFIINPNGILFGSTAQVNVGGLTASTLNISDADFITGNFSFSNGGVAGDITNQGNLTAVEGGYIALIAPKVVNEGAITVTSGTVNSGSVLMAAGDQVTLTLNNGSLLSYTLDHGAIDALAENKQLIQADGGQIILTAKAADVLSNVVVNNTGLIQAQTVQNIGGVIKLLSDAQVGAVNVSGTLDASAPDTGNGGFIETSAAIVTVQDSAQITVQAANGLAGLWLINPTIITSSINNLHQLQLMSMDLTANYTLGADIDATATSTWNSGAGFVPVGTLSTPFTGSFDGLGYTISNLTINQPTSNHIGLFGGNAGTISNVGLVGTSVTGNSNVGGLVGTNTSGSIINCYATGSVTGSSYVGGLVGYNGGGISNTYSTGTVSGNDGIGGLVGYNTGNGTIINTNVTVVGSTQVGGLTGSINGGTPPQFPTFSGTFTVTGISMPMASESAIVAINSAFSPLSLANHPNPVNRSVMPNDLAQPSIPMSLVQGGINLPDGMMGR